jgi:hypothetical protein
MSTYQQWRTVAHERRLSALAHDTAELNLRLSELYKLRDRVRQLSDWKSRRERLDSLSKADPQSRARKPNLHQRLS